MKFDYDNEIHRRDIEYLVKHCFGDKATLQSWGRYDGIHSDIRIELDRREFEEKELEWCIDNFEGQVMKMGLKLQEIEKPMSLWFITGPKFTSKVKKK